MDLCHCAEPAPEKVGNGIMCLNCRMWYDEVQWKQDPRVKRAQLEARQFTKEQQDIVDTIMRDATEA